MDLSVPYRLEPELTPKLYTWVGENYKQQMLFTIIRRAVRDSISSMSWDEIGTSKEGRDQVAASINETLSESVERDLVRSGFTEDQAKEVFRLFPVQIRGIYPPNRIRQAASEKVAAEEELKRQETLTQIAEEEARRRANEGKGVQMMFDELPDGFTADEIARVVNAISAKTRAEAVMKAVNTEQVRNLHIYGDVAPAAAPKGTGGQ